MVNVEYRYELKYMISKSDAAILMKQLRAVMQLDKHSVSDEYSYLIRSLYFDNAYNTAFYDKVDGVEFRSKYRIRYYNYDPSIIKLECKHKDENMTFKEECSLTKKDVENILNGHIELVESNEPLALKFKAEYLAQSLKPSVIVDYKRLAFTHPVSTVRVTFDMDIRSGKQQYDIFKKDLAMFPILPDDQILIEIKCNEFIPGHILAILQSVPLLRVAVSKFAYCRSII